MIRTSSHSLKFTNKNKHNTLNLFVLKYRNMIQKYVNIIWNKKVTKSFLSNTECQTIKTNSTNDSRIRQCAAKQACAIVNSTLLKHNKRLFKLRQLQREGKDTKYLQRKISLNLPTKPTIKNLNIELDSRFVNIQAGKHFDLFVQITQIGNKLKLNIPIKHTKVSKKWLSLGEMKVSIRLNENYLNLYYEIENKEIQGNKVIGADQGQITCLSLSDGQVTKKNKDGYDLNNIQDILTRRTKGSKGFRRTQEHRKNYINWSLNQLNFNNVKEFRLEKIKNIRKGKRNSRKSTHWCYILIKSKLVSLSEDKGFVFLEQDNKFMSQRCSQCGFTHKSNRKGKTFTCKHCGFIADSDLNAASNHEVDLNEIPVMVWNDHINRTTGFFWLKVDDHYDEFIVRHVHGITCNEQIPIFQ